MAAAIAFYFMRGLIPLLLLGRWLLRGGLTMRLICALVVALLLPLSRADADSFRTVALEPMKPAPDFTLKSDEGKQVRLHDWRGDVVVLFFGYTFCPDLCPTTLANLAAVKKQLGAMARRLHVVLVTVDPERDTVMRLHRYTRTFDQSFVGLTGPRRALEKVWTGYGIYVKSHRVRGSSASYEVDHSATTFVIDAQGNLRLAITGGTALDDIRHDVQRLLEQ